MNQSRFYFKILFLFLFAFFASFLWIDWQNKLITSDIAADILHANQLNDQGYLLLGHWSKFGFNHPGPFWFYVNYFFEVILSPFHFERLETWQWGTSFLNSLFITFSAVSLSHYYFNRFQFLYSFLFIFLYVLFTQECSGIWIPYRLTAPYLAFVVSLLHLSRGHFHYAIPAVFLTSILIHGYATLILFTLPFLFLCVILGFQKIKSFQPFYKDLFISVFIATFFASPILIDFYFNSPSNIDYLLSAAQNMENEKHSTFQQVLFTIPSLILTDPQGNILFLFYLPFFGVICFLLFFISQGNLKQALNQKDFFDETLKSKIIFTALLSFSIYIACVFYHWRYTTRFVFYVLFYLMAFPPLLYLSFITPLFFAFENRFNQKPKQTQKTILLLEFFLMFSTILYKHSIFNQTTENFFMPHFRFLQEISNSSDHLKIIQAIEEEYQKTKKTIVIDDPFLQIEKAIHLEFEKLPAITLTMDIFSTAFVESAKNHIPVCLKLNPESLEKHPQLRPFYTPKHLCAPNDSPSFIWLVAPPQACKKTSGVCMGLAKKK